jgi:uncharacterized glyoxalase superfamily protein PhnB
MKEALDHSDIPEGYARVNPWVISADTDMEIGFLAGVFGARERPGSRMLNADGSIGHVEVELDGAVIMMFDAQPGWPPLPSHLRVYVADLDDAVEHGVEGGARVVTRPPELAFGERVARLRDPQGHLWWIHQRVETLDPEEMARRFADPGFQDAMAYVQESLITELSQKP